MEVTHTWIALSPKSQKRVLCIDSPQAALDRILAGISHCRCDLAAKICQVYGLVSGYPSQDRHLSLQHVAFSDCAEDALCRVSGDIERTRSVVGRKLRPNPFLGAHLLG